MREQLVRIKYQTPFCRFVIRLASGTRIHVNDPWAFSWEKRGGLERAGATDGWAQRACRSARSSASIPVVRAKRA
jgi:hypothetical protein